MDISRAFSRPFSAPPTGARCGRGAAPYLLLVLFTALSGCSVRQMAVEALADAVAESGSAYATDDDIDFIGLATPFGLKTTEGLLERVPDHRGLLLSATRGFTQYAYAYVELPANEVEAVDVALAYAERARARRMYLRARDYGLRGLTVTHPAIARSIRREPRTALSTTTHEDVGLLYWTAASWASAISLGKNDPTLIADLPIVEALIRRALELDESYGQGAIHVFLISFEMSQSDVRDGALQRARGHFQRALELSAGLQASPYVAMAEAVSIPLQEKGEYRRLLGEALAVDVGTNPEWRLANLVMQRRARWLLANEDQFFLE